MAARYSDEQIHALLVERKPLPDDWRSKVQLRSKRGHKERDLPIDGVEGSRFRVILRQNDINAFDFSVILAVEIPNSNQLFRLRRYNGKSHEHPNHLEGNTFYDFHIHLATERYQELGTKEDAFAEATTRFDDFQSALHCLFKDCNFDLPDNLQESLFEEF